MREEYHFSDWLAGKSPPVSWDCADAVDDNWSKQQLDDFMRATVRPWTPPIAKGREPDAREDMDRGHPVGDTPPHSPAGGGPVTQLRQTEQEQPATVTHIQTRKTVKADDNWQLGLVTSEEGKIKPSVTKNWALYLEHHPNMAGVFAFDAFKLRVMLQRCPPWEQAGSHWTPRVLQDRDYAEAVMWLEGHYMTPKVSNITSTIQTVAEHSSFDRLREYLDGLVWDGKARVNRFANEYLGCGGDNYAPIVSERWLISSVARGLKPGCKVDTMPILEGPQGAQKSTALRTLYGDEFFTDGLSDIGSKDAKMEMQGVWGLEVAEMHRFSAAETNEVKKFLTQQIDRFRPPYGRSVIEAPRRVILNGTINPEGNAYLRDPTGARRFWPLTCGRIDIDKIAADRDQIWAEAVSMFKMSIPWWVQEDEISEVEAEQAKRTDVDAWVDLIAPFIRTRQTVTQVEILKELGVPTKDIDYRHSGRVARIMRKLGWVGGRDRSGGRDETVFTNPAFEEKDAPAW